MTAKAWIQGLLAAFVTAFSTAAIGVLALPTVFNGSKDGLYNILKMTLVPALISVFTFLKQSPLPSETQTTTVSVSKATTPGPLACLAFLLLTILFSPSIARAQAVSNLYMAGGSYSAGATPAFAGSALYAHQVSPDTAPSLYAFTMIDALPNTLHPFTVTTNIGAGIAQKVATIAGVPIFIPTAAGISYTGPNVGWEWNTGVGAPFKIKTNWYVMPTVRVLKSSVSGGSGYQPIIGILFGWGQ